MVEQDDRKPEDPGRREFLKSGAMLSAASIVLPDMPATLIAEPSAATVEGMLAFFDTLALTQERGGKIRHTWVRKWGWPVTVRLRGAVSPDLRADLADAVDELRGLTGHDIGIEGDGTEHVRSIEIVVSPHDEIVGRFRPPSAVCNTHTRGKRGELYMARVDISEDYTDCLRHELMHALGFANHWKCPTADKSMPSVLAMRRDPHRVWHYSEWDRLAIQVLYDPEMAPGTPRRIALRKADALLRDALA